MLQVPTRVYSLPRPSLYCQSKNRLRARRLLQEMAARTSARMSTRADRYMYGDEVRLTWSFSDQPGGFRDYLGDIYGRRNYGRPAEATQDKLFLKVPFPRFEGMDKDCVGLVMSTALIADPIIESLPVRPLAGEKPSMKRSYQMEDLRFRIDPVNNKGREDADDYMNMVTDGSSQHIMLQLGWDKYKFSSEMRMTLESGGTEAVIAHNALGPLGYATGGVPGLIKKVLDVQSSRLEIHINLLRETEAYG